MRLLTRACLFVLATCAVACHPATTTVASAAEADANGQTGSDTGQSAVIPFDPATLDRGTTLSGVDANQDGLRDDIAQLIQSYPFTTSQQLAATTAYAKVLQALATTSADTTAAVQTAVKLQRARECMAKQIPGYTQYSRQVHAYTFNTEARVQAYLAFQKQLRGQLIDVGAVNPCD